MAQDKTDDMQNEGGVFATLVDVQLVSAGGSYSAGLEEDSKIEQKQCK